MRKEIHIEKSLSDIMLDLHRELGNLKKGLEARNLLDLVIYAQATNIYSDNIDGTSNLECQVPIKQITVEQQIKIIEDILNDDLTHYRRCISTLNGHI